VRMWSAVPAAMRPISHDLSAEDRPQTDAECRARMTAFMSIFRGPIPPPEAMPSALWGGGIISICCSASGMATHLEETVEIQE